MSNRLNPRNRKPETPSMRETAYLADAIFEIIQKEDVFPKRSRWLFSYKIAELTNEMLTAVEEANKPEVQTEALRVRRFEMQQIALGKLSALDRIFTQAIRSVPINPDKLERIGSQMNECEKVIHAWINSDNTELFRQHPEYKRKKRYLYGKRPHPESYRQSSEGRAGKHEAQREAR